MDPSYHYGSYYPDYSDLNLPGSYVDRPPFDRHPNHTTYQNTPLGPTVMPSTQYPAVWDVRDSSRQTPATFSMIPSIDPKSPRASGGGYPFVNAQPTGIHPVQPQPIRLERAVQTSDPATGTWSDGNDSKGHKGFTARKLLLQEIFKTARQQKELDASNVIEFSVYGKKGIRLSDASEGNWGGFEGRDDRSLFGENRLQIMVRLHFIGCLPWQSKVYTTDYTARRRPITRMKLAYEIAKAMRKYIARERANGHDGDPSRCIRKDTLLENVYLTRLVRVSAASWQPEIYVELPSAAAFPASSSSSS